MNARGIVRILLLFAFAPALLANPFTYRWQEVASGVWAAIRDEPFELPQEGNAVFVVTSEGVVLFDAGGSPLMGEEIVEKVRAVTDRPITHVVISHWHGDHMRGLQAIRTAFPNATVYAHPHSREKIAATEEKWRKRRVTMVPNIRKGVAAALEKQQDLQGRPLIDPEKRWLERGLSIVDQLDRENNRTDYVQPTASIDRQLDLRLGGRRIEFLHPGNAHTAGDLIMWLPKERVVATGDIVTAPIPLMPSPYVKEYVAVLDRIESLKFRTLIPGHGLVEQDSKYVATLRELFATASSQASALAAKGVSTEDAAKKIDLSAIETRFTHGDPFLAHRFADYVGSALPTAAALSAAGQPVEEPF